MLACSIEAAVATGRRLVLGAAYGAFVAIVTASWIAARPASAEVSPGSALGRPRPAPSADGDAAPIDGPEGTSAGGTPHGVKGPVFGPAPPPGLADAGTASEPEPHGDDGELRGRLNLNNATKEELELLPGIGDAISDRVLAWRERHGRFHRVKDLRRVRGIGPKTLEELRPYLTILGPTTLRETDG